MYVCMFTYSSITDPPIFPHTPCLFLETGKIFCKGRNFESDLVSTSGKYFCALQPNDVKQRRYDQDFFVEKVVGTHCTATRKVSWFRVLARLVFLCIEN